MAKKTIEPNQEWLVRYPFCLEKYEHIDGYSAQHWKPGCEVEPTYNEEFGFSMDIDYVCHGRGYMALKVVDLFTPRGRQQRVFYVRQWVQPDGRIVGNKTLRVTTNRGFQSLLRGYRYPHLFGDDLFGSAPEEAELSPIPAYVPDFPQEKVIQIG